MSYKIKDQFKIDEHFRLYIDIAYKRLPEAMPAGQIQELRRAFFGSWGMAIVCLRDEVGKIPDENKCVAVLENMMKQVTDQMLAETGRNQ